MSADIYILMNSSNRLLISFATRRTYRGTSAAAAAVAGQSVLTTSLPASVSSRVIFPSSSSSFSDNKTTSFSKRPFHMSSSAQEPRKAGVASPEELRAFVAAAGSRLVVMDVRNPDAVVEPGDQKSLALAPLPSPTARPQALHMIFDRSTGTIPALTEDRLEKDTPIITHCGGGGRGNLAKEFLESKGFTNVLNGGGPKETECWAEFGDR